MSVYLFAALNQYDVQRYLLRLVRASLLIVTSGGQYLGIILCTWTASDIRSGDWAGAKRRSAYQPRFGYKTSSGFQRLPLQEFQNVSCPITSCCHLQSNIVLTLFHLNTIVPPLKVHYPLGKDICVNSLSSNLIYWASLPYLRKKEKNIVRLLVFQGINGFAKKGDLPVNPG